MAYSYLAEKGKLFTDDGQRLFIGMRDHIKSLLNTAGAFRSEEAMRLPPGMGAADSWTMLAVLDRMVELGELYELTGPDVARQHRVFVKVR